MQTSIIFRRFVGTRSQQSTVQAISRDFRTLYEAISDIADWLIEWGAFPQLTSKLAKKRVKIAYSFTLGGTQILQWAHRHEAVNITLSLFISFWHRWALPAACAESIHAMISTLIDRAMAGLSGTKMANGKFLVIILILPQLLMPSYYYFRYAGVRETCENTKPHTILIF